MGKMFNNKSTNGLISIDCVQECTNVVCLELTDPTEIDSLVFAYRYDGELVELAERSPPAAAVIEGDTLSE